MNFKEQVEKLRKFFSTEEEVKMMEAKSADGAILNIEPALEQGAKVYVVDAEGKTPVANGELKLEDGTVLVCEGGAIMEIKPAEEKKDEEAAKGQAPNEMEAKFNEQIGSLRELFESLVKRIENIEQGFASKEEVKEVKEFSKQMLEVVEAMANEPGSTPAETPKQGFGTIRNAKKAFRDELKSLRKS